eukprot:TRINITY_DN6306_c0_g1_i1.p1 TRINITY_DN6306_c0_g1~~TRINITY_DN6306_c0_g1_i1.p1  ORF type:complete len:115 (-),score=38.81 TRINITY_DN6306_c0_g1_i1:337-681(-)
MGAKSVREALHEVDIRQPDHADHIVDKLFHKLDLNKTGYIEGQTFEEFIDDATEYVMLEYQRQGAPQDRAQLRQWVVQTIDINHDNRISQNELKLHLKTVLDENETGRQHAAMA